MSAFKIQAVNLDAYGLAAPKGSARAMMTRGANPRPVLVASGSKTNEAKQQTWRAAVVEACKKYPGRAAIDGGHPPMCFDPKRALAIAIVFRFPMLQGDLRSDGYGPRLGVNAIAVTGRDADKLMRSTLDAITVSQRIWIDDSRAAAPMAVRLYVPPGQWHGARILIGYDALGVCRWYYDQLKTAEAEMKKAAETAAQLATRERAQRKAPGQEMLLR